MIINSESPLMTKYLDILGVKPNFMSVTVITINGEATMSQHVMSDLGSHREIEPIPDSFCM